MTALPGGGTDLYQQIVGEQLSAVTFVMDYVQLDFNRPPFINAYTPIAVVSDGIAIISGDDQFRNALCRQITKIVAAVVVVPEDAFRIVFADTSTISISLRLSDYTCAEAIYFQGRESRWNVI